MNLKTELSTKHQILLNEIGFKVEDKEYSFEELKLCEAFITSHIMSKSSKNGDIAKELSKYTDLVNILLVNQK